MIRRTKAASVTSSVVWNLPSKPTNLTARAETLRYPSLPMSEPPKAPHRRYNPLLHEWVLCSPHRLQRPWQGQVEDEPEEARPRYDPSCYLCPGNVRANGQRNPAYATTFAFDNDYPALLPSSEAPAGGDDGLLVAEPARGRCRVLCFSPHHDRTLAEMDASEIRPVVDAWAAEFEALGRDPAIAYVQVFENKGAMMGCSNPHPHCQVWATGHVPLIPARKGVAQEAYFARHGRDLVGDYLEKELSSGERVVFRNEHWVALVPFWAVWPFEAMLVPVRRVGDLPSLAGPERDALADAVRRLTARYDNLFRTSFPYSMGFHSRPTDGREHPYWRLHAVYFPPLLRSATVRKFLVGYELTAEPQRDLTAEDAAARLRALPETHYRRSSTR
jgi:UDPglucose--hexose-1-phosphate uridylyltransferase